MAVRTSYLRWKQNLRLDAVSTVANTASNTGASAVQQSEALAAASGAVNAPTYNLTDRFSFYIVALSCSTSGASIQYQINGGGYGTYTGSFTAEYGDVLDTYATHAGLTDSGIISVIL